MEAARSLRSAKRTVWKEHQMAKMNSTLTWQGPMLLLRSFRLRLNGTTHTAGQHENKVQLAASYSHRQRRSL